MTRDKQEQEPKTRADDATATTQPSQDRQDDELEAEQESAAAMDSDVPQPPQASETTEGQPS